VVSVLRLERRVGRSGLSVALQSSAAQFIQQACAFRAANLSNSHEGSCAQWPTEIERLARQAGSAASKGLGG
jgi:hypothetical protein